MRWLESLQAKLLAAVCGVALVSIGVFAWVNIRYEQAERVDLMIRGTSHFSDTVKRSTHYAMLQNRWEDAFHIMDTIGKQEGVTRVRVFSKEGVILFSTDRSEVGSAVDKRAESCYACHAAEQPLERLMLPDRTRIFRDAEGRRLLAMILAGIVRRGVVRPVRELVEETRRVAHGDLTHRIPVRTVDEVGVLAASFNRMTEALGKAQAELDALVATLEQRVEERTRELRDAQAQLIQTWMSGPSSSRRSPCWRTGWPSRTWRWRGGWHRSPPCGPTSASSARPS